MPTPVGTFAATGSALYGHHAPRPWNLHLLLPALAVAEAAGVFTGDRITRGRSRLRDAVERLDVRDCAEDRCRNQGSGRLRLTSGAASGRLAVRTCVRIVTQEVTHLDFVLKAAFLEQWDGNRRLTLRVARAFPPDQLWTFAPTASLRPFGAMLDEIARLELAYLRGLAEDKWEWDPQNPPRATDAAGAIAFLEEARAYTRRVWDSIPAATLLTPRKDPFFFGSDKRPYDWLLYCLENEIHHRGQGYIYLRELGVEPPPFWER